MKLLETVFKTIQRMKKLSFLSPSVSLPQRSCVSSLQLMDLKWDYEMFLCVFFNAVTSSSVKNVASYQKMGKKVIFLYKSMYFRQSCKCEEGMLVNGNCWLWSLHVNLSQHVSVKLWPHVKGAMAQNCCNWQAHV